MANIERIREERLNAVNSLHLYTQEYLAEKSNICISTYKNYMNKPGSMKVPTLLRILKTLNCDFYDIFPSMKHRK